MVGRASEDTVSSVTRLLRAGDDDPHMQSTGRTCSWTDCLPTFGLPAESRWLARTLSVRSSIHLNVYSRVGADFQVELKTAIKASAAIKRTAMTHGDRCKHGAVAWCKRPAMQPSFDVRVTGTTFAR
jgi:hypothetical protein